ncbi:MAG TPA: hypothetical protein VMD30_08020 [Tepidisphaeraceae bacterium]|nr:hypothetical protein [Tepidisphaeraceae bacterium]
MFLNTSAFAATPQPDAKLTEGCNHLIEKSVFRSYGIAWSTDRDRAPLVSYAPGKTPAAGWILWEAGRICHNARFTRAAINVARGMANGQEAGGKFPNTVRFGMADDRGQDTPEYDPDRASTCAALGLFLTILHDSPHPDPRLRSCALMAARWLSLQQTAYAAWPVASEGPGQYTRTIRLDSPDWRNSTMALMLAADVFHNRRYQRQAQLAATMLLDLNLPKRDTQAAGCWTGAYSLNKLPRSDVPDAPLALDTLATRYSLQTLIAEAVCEGDIPALERIHTACNSMQNLQETEGSLLRYVPLDTGKIGSIELSAPPDLELPEVLHTVQEVDVKGLAEFARAFDASGIGGANGLDEELARIITGAGDDAFNPQCPTLAAMAATAAENMGQ